MEVGPHPGREETPPGAESGLVRWRPAAQACSPSSVLTAGGSGTGLMTFPGSGLALYHFTVTRTETRKARKITAAKRASSLRRFAALPTGARALGLQAGPGRRRTSPEGGPGVCGPGRAGRLHRGVCAAPPLGPAQPTLIESDKNKSQAETAVLT